MKGTNTVLIVIVILILAAFGAYWYAQQASPQVQEKNDTQDSGIQIKIGGDATTTQ